jgi:hypothetical protein
MTELLHNFIESLREELKQYGELLAMNSWKPSPPSTRKARRSRSPAGNESSAIANWLARSTCQTTPVSPR